MEKKRNDTKSHLAQALFDLLCKKSFQKISVNDLCDACKIHRSTFYRHFEDKYQLLRFCFDELAKEMDTSMESKPSKEFFVAILDHCQKHEKLFYNLFYNGMDDELSEIFYQFSSRYLLDCLNEKASQGVLLPGPIDALAAFYVGGFTNMIKRWIRSGYKTPKETLASCIYKLLKDIL